MDTNFWYIKIHTYIEPTPPIEKERIFRSPQYQPFVFGYTIGYNNMELPHTPYGRHLTMLQIRCTYLTPCRI